jgi:hypothetical protein
MKPSVVIDGGGTSGVTGPMESVVVQLTLKGQELGVLCATQRDNGERNHIVRVRRSFESSLPMPSGKHTLTLKEPRQQVSQSLVFGMDFQGFATVDPTTNGW